MSTRTRPTSYAEPSLSSSGQVDLSQLSDQELETFLFQEEEKEEKSSSWSPLPTLTGGAMMLVGVLYVLQNMGLWNGMNMTGPAATLPILAGVLITVLGFGLFKKKPKPITAGRVRPVPPPVSRTRTQPRAETGEETFSTTTRATPPPLAQRKTLSKSTNKKISGVAAGIAEYFNIDPTWVRVAFVIGLFATQGVAVLVYLAMAMVLPNPPKLTLEERLRMLRNS